MDLYYIEDTTKPCPYCKKDYKHLAGLERMPTCGLCFNSAIFVPFLGTNHYSVPKVECESCLSNYHLASSKVVML